MGVVPLCGCERVGDGWGGVAEGVGAICDVTGYTFV